MKGEDGLLFTKKRRISEVACGVATVTFALMFATLVAELLTRLLVPQVLGVPWLDEMDGITAPRPNVHGRHSIPETFDVVVTINSQRFRHSSTFSVPPTGVRIAVLGDSFAFGYGAGDYQTYPFQLESILNGQNKAKRYEVINAANCGTGTGEQALWYETWVKRYEPSTIVLTVTSNDVDDDLARRLFEINGEKARERPAKLRREADNSLRRVRAMVNAIPGYALLAQNSQFLCLLRNGVSSILVSHQAQPIDVMLSQRFVPEEERRWLKGLSLMTAEIDWLRTKVQESGAHLLVVFVPSRETVYAESGPRAAEITWKSVAIINAINQVCRTNRTPFLDLTQLLRQRALGSPHELYYQGRDTHPNPAGYRLIAEYVAAFLLANGIG